MTDTERERINAICEVAGVAEIDDLSDGFHTFRQLYYQRMMLFATIVKQNKDKAWKSLRHEDGGLCFGGGWFIVGIDTPEGSYTYHYENKYFDLFDCEILDYSKHWDGHTEKDVTRLLSLPNAQLSQEGTTSDLIERQQALNALTDAVKSVGVLDADDIKTVFDMLPSVQPEPQWIPVSERMPEEHEWLGTKKFGTTISDEVYVTFENEKGERFCKHMSFQNGKLSSYYRMDAVTKAVRGRR